MHRPETVYDRCCYMGCTNGKYRNKKRLFSFPLKNDPRLAKWIENCGNEKLRFWAPSTLRRAGVCADHFSPDSFTVNYIGERLRRNAVPLPYDKLCESAATIRIENVYSLKPVDTHQSLQLPVSPANEELLGTVDDDVKNEIFEQSILQQSYDFPESPSDIVIEKHEQTSEIFEQSTVQQFYNFPEASSDIVIEKHELGECPNPEPAPSTSKQQIERSENSVLNNCRDKTILAKQDAKDIVIDSLNKQNIVLRQQVKHLKQKVQRAILRESKNSRNKLRTSKHKRMEMLRILDELNLTPASRAMTKLQLHVPNAKYTTEEMNLAKLLYRHSTVALLRLRKAGCNFPSPSSIKRWISQRRKRRGFHDSNFNTFKEAIRQPTR